MMLVETPNVFREVLFDAMACMFHLCVVHVGVH